MLCREQPSKFTRRHPMPYRDRVDADERGKGRIEHVSFNAHAGDGVRSIEDDKRQPCRRCGLLGVGHRGDVRGVADAHVLDIEDQRVEPTEHVARWVQVIAVEAVDGKPGAWIRRRLNLLTGLCGAAHAVLRTEEGDKIDHVAFVEEVSSTPQAAVNSRGIGDQANAPAGELWVTLGEEHIEAGAG